MNSTSQLEFHPDAESLNAFVEQVLPERERGQILAHLAACSRCRQVIYFAQEAASGLETGEAAAVPTGPAANRSGSWFWGWRIAWIPAAALAAIVGLAVFVHVRHMRAGSEAGSELARVTPQLAPEQEGRVTEPSPQKRAGAATAQSPVAPGAARLSEGKGRPAVVRATSKALSAEAIPPVAPPVETSALQMSNAERDEAALPPGAQGQGFAAQADTALVKPEAAAAVRQPQRAVGALSSHAMAAKASQARMESMADRVQASRTVSLSAPVLQLQTEPVLHGNLEVAGQLPMAAIVAARGAKIAVLPSGLSAVSTATAEHLTLAIDMVGALFLSEDSGKHWEPVARQWSGRAVVVRIQHGLNGYGAVAAGAAAGGAEDGSNGLTAGVAVATPVPAAVFEIVTDSDLVWVSTDGKTWKAK